MNAHGYLVERAEHEQAERERFKAVLGPADCCSYGCDQKGHSCPARSYPLETAQRCAPRHTSTPAERSTPTRTDMFIGRGLVITSAIVALSFLAAAYLTWGPK